MRKFQGTPMFATLLAGAAMLVGTAAVQAQKISTDYDHKADFSRYHTFSLFKVHASNSIVEGRLRDDITQALQQRGWQQVQQGGDLAVTAIGSVQNQKEYTSFYDGFGPGWGYGGWRGRYGFGGWGGGGDTMTREYNVPVGMLTVDLYDSSTHQLVFRGEASDELSNNADKNAKKGEKAVDKIFNKLPGKKQG